jgi:uncharacterized protein with ParB-like and HNH nuclease domain
MSKRRIVEHSESLSDFFDGTKSHKIIIPKYQRSYSWEKSNVEDLLNDFFYNEREDSQWYLNTVFTMREGNSIVLIDGQQRITTLCFILKELTLYKNTNQKSLYDSHKDNKDLINEFELYPAKNLHRLLMVNENETRISLDTGNDNFFQIYIKSNDPKQGKRIVKLKSQQLMNDAISMIRKRLFEEIGTNLERLKNIVSFIISSKIEILKIDLKDKSDYYRIFEGINDRGRALSDSDKFKNLSLLYMEESKREDFEKKWFDNLEALFNIKKEFKTVFNYLPLSDGVDSTEPYAEHIKKKVEETGGSEKDKRKILNERFIAVSRQVKGIVCIYNKDKDISDLYFTNSDNLTKKEKDAAIRITLICKVMWEEYPQFGIVFYGLIKNYNFSDDNSQFTDLLRELSISMKYFLILIFQGYRAQEIRPKLIELINNYYRAQKSILPLFEKKVEEFSKDDLLAKHLYKKANPNFCGLVICIIQAHFNKNYIDEHINIHRAQLSLEHFVPRKWKDNWSYLKDNDFKEFNKKYNNENNFLLKGKTFAENYLEKDENDNFIIEHIGNKFWLRKPTNSSLGNKSFNDKKKRLITEGVVYFPYNIDGLLNVTEMKSFNLCDILSRTEVMVEKLKSAIESNKAF